MREIIICVGILLTTFSSLMFYKCNYQTDKTQIEIETKEPEKDLNSDLSELGSFSDVGGEDD